MMVAMAERCALFDGARMLKVTASPDASVKAPLLVHLNPADCKRLRARFRSRGGRGTLGLNQSLLPGETCCQIGTARLANTIRTIPWRSIAEEIAWRKR